MADEQRLKLESQVVFVTGAGGFIGSALVRALLGCGASVRALVGAPGQATFELAAEVTQVEADIEDQSALSSLAEDAAIALHLAGPPSVAASFSMPVEYGRVHVGGTTAMLEACRIGGVRRFVYVSSAEVYGRPAITPVAEDQPLSPRSPYAAAKAAAEQLVRAYDHSGMETFVLRPFSVYGPGLAGRSVLGTIIRQALWKDEVVLADLAPVRDYVYLDDVVNGILRAATVTGPGGATFNLGSGEGISVAAATDLVLKLVGRDLPVRADPSRGRPIETDIDRLVADPTRARAGLGWSAEISLREGLCRTLEWSTAQR